MLGLKLNHVSKSGHWAHDGLDLLSQAYIISELYSNLGIISGAAWSIITDSHCGTRFRGLFLLGVPIPLRGH